MSKRSFISFASLFVFWIVISGAINLQHIIVGIVLSLITTYFWKDLTSKLPGILSPMELLLFSRCILMLIGHVIKSNIDVAKTLLFSDLSTGSMFMELEPGIESDWGKVFLASCITITPGTITVDVDPETNVFAIHALTRENGISLYYWSIITEVRNLERLVQRRKAYDVDTGGIHGSNSISAIESDHRTDGN